MITVSEIANAVRSHDEVRLQELVGSVATFCFKKPEDVEEAFSDYFFNGLIAVIDSEAFLTMPGGGALLVLFEYDWQRLTESQKGRLLKLLEVLFPKFNDSSARFVAAELLGGYFANRPAFEVANRLYENCTNEKRALLPLAFENFVAESPDVLLKQEALTTLERMQRDTFEQVREEAALSFSRLRSKGLLF
jgi:hypothetical protein